MSTRLNPYLNFQNQARQAIEFYQSVLGGKLAVSTYEGYQVSQDPAENDKVMHAQLETDNGLVLMASDVPDGMEYKPGNNMTVSLSGDNEEELRGYWEKLADGGTVVMPLDKAPWGDTFGMLTDKFGVQWMVDITTPQVPKEN